MHTKCQKKWNCYNPQSIYMLFDCALNIARHITYPLPFENILSKYIQFCNDNRIRKMPDCLMKTGYCHFQNTQHCWAWINWNCQLLHETRCLPSEGMKQLAAVGMSYYHLKTGCLHLLEVEVV